MYIKPNIKPPPQWFIDRMEAVKNTPRRSNEEVECQFSSGQHYVALAKDFQKLGFDDKEAWDEACKILNDKDLKLEYVCDKKRHLVCLPYRIPYLHRMARDLVIRRRWFHGTHYDIPVKKLDEIISKCRLVSSKDIVRIIRGETI